MRESLLMLNFHLETKDIIKITGQRFYKRGLDYFKKGRVKNLTYNSSIQSFSASIKGGDAYDVRIFFFEDDDLEASCTCPAYLTHYTCKHIAAVLLAIRQHQQPDQQLATVDSEPIDPFPMRMIEAFQSLEPLVNEKELLEVHYFLKEVHQSMSRESQFELELKVGKAQPFIVKDIHTFIHDVLNNKEHTITDKFKYNPSSDTFTNRDWHIFQLLNKAMQHDQQYLSDYLTQKQRVQAIPGFLMAELLRSIESQTLTFTNVAQKSFSTIECHNLDQGIEVTIDYSDEGVYVIDFSSLFAYHYLTHYHLLVKHNQFYVLTDQESETLERLYDLLPYRKRDQFKLSRDKFSHFRSFVIPKLEEVATVTYSTRALHSFEINALEVIMNIELIGESVSLDLTFKYGEHIFHPNEDVSHSDQTYVRNIKEEQSLLQTLNHLGFHYLNQRYQLFKQSAIYHFIIELIPIFKERYTVHLSQPVEDMINDDDLQFFTSVNYNNDSGMLDIAFDIEGINDDEVSDILAALIEKKRYHHVKEGRLIDLNDDAFEQFKKFAEQLHLKKQDLAAQGVSVSPHRTLQVEEVFEERKQYSDSFKLLLSDLKLNTHDPEPLPKELQATLRDYQHTGFQWFKTLARYRLGGILADEMGLGKTLQAIAFMLSEKALDDSRPSLVISPSSLVYNWKKEFEKFAPSLTVKVISGTQTQRLEQLNSEKVDVWITSYPLLRKDISFYQAHLLDHFILDEAQAIKNHLTLTAKATRLIKAKYRFALSGTPIENRVEELWSIFQTLSPGFLGSKKQFIHLERDLMKKMIRPFILRRLKTDVLKDLPEKFEFEKYAELTKEQKQVYLGYVKRIEQKLTQPGNENNKLEILAGLTRLRQICCHPKLFLDNYQGHSGKLELFMTILKQLQEENRRVLIFSQFPSMLKIITQEIESINLNHFYLDGQTPSKERVEMSERFNQGERDLFLISLKAGGTGLNLTGADTVILFDLWWNPAVEAQAAGRAHRIGQTKKVEVIRLITEGTIEEKIFKLQEKKRKLVDDVIAPGETLLTSLTKEELQSLLAFDPK